MTCFTNSRHGRTRCSSHVMPRERRCAKETSSVHLQVVLVASLAKIAGAMLRRTASQTPATEERNAPSHVMPRVSASASGSGGLVGKARGRRAATTRFTDSRSGRTKRPKPCYAKSQCISKRFRRLGWQSSWAPCCDDLFHKHPLQSVCKLPLQSVCKRLR